jgi:hypothetical protein
MVQIVAESEERLRAAMQTALGTAVEQLRAELRQGTGSVPPPSTAVPPMVLRPGTGTAPPLLIAAPPLIPPLPPLPPPTAHSQLQSPAAAPSDVEQRTPTTSFTRRQLPPESVLPVWALVESDSHIQRMLRDVRKQLRECTEPPTAPPPPPATSDVHSHGVLYVWLSHGTGLKATDKNGLSDPYVRLYLGGATVRSQVIYKTLDPCWDESFQFIGTLGALLAEPLRLVVSPLAIRTEWPTALRCSEPPFGCCLSTCLFRSTTMTG